MYLLHAYMSFEFLKGSLPLLGGLYLRLKSTIKHSRFGYIKWEQVLVGTPCIYEYILYVPLWNSKMTTLLVKTEVISWIYLKNKGHFKPSTLLWFENSTYITIQNALSECGVYSLVQRFRFKHITKTEIHMRQQIIRVKRRLSNIFFVRNKVNIQQLFSTR